MKRGVCPVRGRVLATYASPSARWIDALGRRERLGVEHDDSTACPPPVSARAARSWRARRPRTLPGGSTGSARPASCRCAACRRDEIGSADDTSGEDRGAAPAEAVRAAASNSSRCASNDCTAARFRALPRDEILKRIGVTSGVLELRERVAQVQPASSLRAPAASCRSSSATRRQRAAGARLAPARDHAR